MMTNCGRKLDIVRHICVLVAVLMLTAVGGYGWFRARVYQGSAMQYEKTIKIGSNDSELRTYVGVKDAETDSIEYLPMFSLDSDNQYVALTRQDCLELTDYLLPGERQYFYTDIINNSSGDTYVSLYLEDVFYDTVLNNYLYVAVTSPTVSLSNYSSIALDATAEFGAEGRAMMKVTSLPLARHLFVGANSTVRVYWYIYIDTEAGNECIGSSVYIDFMRLMFNS